MFINFTKTRMKRSPLSILYDEYINITFYCKHGLNWFVSQKTYSKKFHNFFIKSEDYIERSEKENIFLTTKIKKGYNT